MLFKSLEHVRRGVTQREFDIRVAGETVPCVLWTPAEGEPRALIAMGHGGSQHKTCEDVRERALRYANTFGWATLALDAPGHGDRISPEEAVLAREKTRARVLGEAGAPALSVGDKIAFLDALAAQAVPEWQAALDAVLATNTLEKRAPVAYWGVSQGSSIGIPLLAADERFICAVLGLAHLHPEHVRLREAARRVTIPLRFALQWDDPIRDRQYGLDLFDAFGSREKSLHVNPGGHLDVPASEAASWEHFFERHIQASVSRSVTRA